MMPPLPLLVASSSRGAAFDHAQLLPRGAADGPPRLEKFSELKREAVEANELAERLQKENDRLRAENTVLERANRELKAVQIEADSGRLLGKPAQQEIKELKQQLKKTKGQLALTSRKLKSSQRTVAELRANATPTEPSPTNLQRAPPPRHPGQRGGQRSAAAARARSEPPHRHDESSSSETESDSEYSGTDRESGSPGSGDKDYDRGYSSRGYFSSDEDPDSSDESDFDRPTSRRTRERRRRRQRPEDTLIEGTLNVARQSLPLKDYEKFRQYTDHRRRVASVASSVDTTAPRQFAHVRHNAKRAQQEKERKLQQRRDSKRMVQRVREMQQQRPISHW